VIQSVDTVKEKGLRALEPAQFELVAETEGALVLDTRGAQTFKDGFVPRSVLSADLRALLGWNRQRHQV
jgi:hypothetical protein